eukprot:scaffold77922_cov18-Tisochrysis_lutea.AAC.2
MRAGPPGMHIHDILTRVLVCGTAGECREMGAPAVTPTDHESKAWPASSELQHLPTLAGCIKMLYATHWNATNMLMDNSKVHEHGNIL